MNSIGGTPVTVENRGTFSNVIFNYGTIEAAPGPSSPRIQQAIAATSGTNQAVYFVNEVDATVIGNLTLANGNDTVELLPGSTITGNLDGGGGTDTLILNADSSHPTGELNGQLNNFEILNKVGTGAWEITGALSNTAGSLAVDVNQGALILTGNSPRFNGSVTVDPSGTLQLGNGGTSGSLANDITDNGAVAFNRADAITFANAISGSGVVEQNGTGTTTLTGANTYSGGTIINSGTLAAGSDAVLGSATGGLTFNGGTFQFNLSFDLAASRPITIDAPGGTINTQGSAPRSRRGSPATAG